MADELHELNGLSIYCAHIHVWLYDVHYVYPLKNKANIIIITYLLLLSLLLLLLYTSYSLAWDTSTVN